MKKKPIVRDFLDAKLVAVTADVSIKKVVLMLNDLKIGAALVVDEKNNIIGIFTERDVLTRVIPFDLNPDNTPVGKVMTANVQTIRDSITANDALIMMNDKQVRNLPVVDDNNKPLGVLNIVRLSQVIMQEMVENFIGL